MGLTTEHAASSYGVPVLVYTETGEASEIALPKDRILVPFR